MQTMTIMTIIQDTTIMNNQRKDDDMMKRLAIRLVFAVLIVAFMHTSYLTGFIETALYNVLINTFAVAWAASVALLIITKDNGPNNGIKKPKWRFIFAR